MKEAIFFVFIVGNQMQVKSYISVCVLWLFAEIKSKTVYSVFSGLKGRLNFNQGDIHLKENLKIISVLCMQLLT